MLRPVSNLSVLKDLVREEMSPNIDDSRKKSAMKNTDSARKSSKRVRFDESVEHNNKVINIVGLFNLPFFVRFSNFEQF